MYAKQGYHLENLTNLFQRCFDPGRFLLKCYSPQNKIGLLKKKIIFEKKKSNTRQQLRIYLVKRGQSVTSWIHAAASMIYQFFLQWKQEQLLADLNVRSLWPSRQRTWTLTSSVSMMSQHCPKEVTPWLGFMRSVYSGDGIE